MLGEQATPERSPTPSGNGSASTGPFREQYLLYMGRSLQGDLGISIVRGDPVLPTSCAAFPPPWSWRRGHGARARHRRPARHRLGRAAAIDHRQPVARGGAHGRVDADLLARADAGLGLRRGARWLPTGFRLDAGTVFRPVTNFVILDASLQGDWAMLRDALRHLVLPAVALATIPLAVIARMTRASMLEVLSRDYIRTADAKGLSPGDGRAPSRAAERAAARADGRSGCRSARLLAGAS